MSCETELTPEQHRRSELQPQLSILEKYAARDRQFMRLVDALDLSRALSDRIDAEADRPNAVVGIANGGLLPSRVIGEQLGLPLYMLPIQRRASTLKRRVFRVPMLGRLLATLYRAPFTQRPLKRINRKLQHVPDMRVEQSSLDLSSLAGAHAILVDDAVVTGETLRCARTALLKAGCRQVTAAALVYRRNPKKTCHDSPDLFLLPRLPQFPWSLDSPHRDEYSAWLKEHGQTDPR